MEAWTKIIPSIITRSFKACGIAKRLDGSGVDVCDLVSERSLLRGKD